MKGVSVCVFERKDPGIIRNSRHIETCSTHPQHAKYSQVTPCTHACHLNQRQCVTFLQWTLHAAQLAFLILILKVTTRQTIRISTTESGELTTQALDVTIREHGYVCCI